MTKICHVEARKVLSIDKNEFELYLAILFLEPLKINEIIADVRSIEGSEYVIVNMKR